MDRMEQARRVMSLLPVKAEQPAKLDEFACNVFTDREIAARVPKATYKAFKAAVKQAKTLDPHVADVIATAMKDWAVERGATHFTHWFQPIHISTAEKHEAFLTPRGDDFKVIHEFTGEQLVRGEPDASSFPNGGTRSTSRARGYTTWDPTSPAFIRDGTNGATLYIPTCFCSWTGDALDVKTPLLRSVIALSAQAVRLLRLLGDTETEHVQTTLGAEQEFFVVDRSYFAARPDLLFAGRTLFGAKPPKGQELEDHYFATIPARVHAFIQEVESELWKLGVPTRARHNEVAPGQHEMAPVFEFSNMASDHNMVQMELLREIATRHGLACLLHEKPFANVNGSGKHNNWSMCTDSGQNLLEPSANPRANLIFQCFLSCILHAVDTHADLLRASIATPGNDWRLGMSEAPPAIMSIYLGADILGLVDWIRSRDPAVNGVSTAEDKDPSLLLHLGKSAIAPFRRDRTDRNRTSPFAFTGNKFEFRAVGSSQNVGHTVTVLNTIVADSIKTFSDLLEKTIASTPSLESAIITVNQYFIKAHDRIIFEGDGYSEEWVKEAAKRGLPNLRETVVALEGFAAKKNIDLFQAHGVLNPGETMARYNIYLEHYVNTINVEANVVTSVVNSNIIPAILKHSKRVADSIASVEAILGKDEASPQRVLLKKIQGLLNQLILGNQQLSTTLDSKPSFPLHKEEAEWMRDQVKPKMDAIRVIVDSLEPLVEDELWTLPKYSELLFIK